MSVATELTRIQTAKANIKAAIEAKGVSIPSTATIDTYPTYVQEIPQGGGEAKNYFKITNRTDTAGTVTFMQSGSAYNLKLKISSDGTNWDNYDMSATTTVTLPANGYIMLDGSENSMWSYETNKRWQISADVDHNVSGEISTLLGNTMNIAFSYLFFKNTHLIDASNLSLNYSILNNSSYECMFFGCTGLTSAPALPAMVLGDSCYRSMFAVCHSLTTAPALPATNLINKCYYNMFNSCRGLTTAPELPATTLATSCYSNMFSQCSNLATAPVLPASALTNYCYEYMFANCSSLSSITCFAMTKTNNNSTSNWVNGINTTGILYVASGNSMNWTQGNNGYPSTWELKVYGEEPASDRTVEITDIPTPPTEQGSSPYVSVNLETPTDVVGIYTYMEFKKEYVDDEFVVTMTIDDGSGNPVTGYTTAYTNSALTISGPWGDDVSISYNYYDAEINCEQVPIDSDVSETFTGDTISLSFPTLETNAECQCGKEGGEWDGDNNVCVHPTGLFLRLSSIPDDGNVHTVTITDADSRECTLSIDMSDYSYTESADADDKYSVHMENDDIANSTAEWIIEGNLYGTYTIDVDGNTLLNEPDYDGSGNFVLVTYDYNDDTMTNYCSRDAFDCEIGGGTYDCQTGECGYAV